MNGAARLPLVDGLKVVAAQAIVWHHIAFYGPMSDHAAVLAPELFDALARHARIAVQIFLVVGGYLAARQLAPQGRWLGGTAAGPLMGRRYLRLVAPYAAMLFFAILAAAVARTWITHDSIPAAPTLAQLLAHLLLLQDLLGIDALSAGVWYVAIDFQLYVLLVGVLLLAARLSPRAAPWMVAALVALSLLAVNRDARWDVAASYFFGAYGLGVLAAWHRPNARWPLWGVVGLVAIALAVEWRSRIALAGVTALALALWGGRGGPNRVLAYWADRSYALFLIHFPVLLLVNAGFTRWAAPAAGVQMAGVLLAWLASLAAAVLFHRAFEQRFDRSRRLRLR
jgi:peptidoglycan/LPS O-acetylase OafA/YrhL